MILLNVIIEFRGLEFFEGIGFVGEVTTDVDAEVALADVAFGIFFIAVLPTYVIEYFDINKECIQDWMFFQINALLTECIEMTCVS